MKKFIRKQKTYIQELFSIQTTPFSLGLGAGIGSFIDILPTFFGLNILFALLVVFIYPRISKLALFGTLLFWNPLFLAPLYLASYNLSNLFYPQVTAQTLFGKFWQEFLVGNLFIAVAGGVVLFGVVWLVAWIIQNRKKPSSA